MKILVYFLLGGLLSQGFAYADQAEQNHKFVHEFATEYKKFRTLKELIANANIPVGDYAFLKRQIRGMEGDKPAEVREVNGALQFITKEMTVSLKPISLVQKRFEVNGKVLTLLGLNAKEKWELLAGALPKKNESALIWDLLLPQAEANPAFLLRIASSGFTYIMAGLGVATTIGAAADSISSQNNTSNALCSEVDGALSNCRGVAIQVEIERQRRARNREDMETKGKPSVTTEKNKEQSVIGAMTTEKVAAAREKGKVEDCSTIPATEDNEKLDNKVLGVVTQASMAKRKADQIFKSCKSKNDLEECIGKLVVTASGMCAKAGYAAWFPELEKTTDPPKPLDASALKSTTPLPVDGIAPAGSESKTSTATTPSTGR